MAENKEKIESIDFDTLGSKDSSKKEDTSNIFDDFNTDASLQEDLKKLKAEKEKNIFFYLNLATRVTQVLFLLVFLTSAFGYAYIYIQKDASLESQSYLDPVCNFIAGDISIPNPSCSSVASLREYYDNETVKLKQDHSTKIIEVLPKVYEAENFLQSKEVQFLLDRTENKMKILDILSKFDSMKNDFLGLDRKRLVCENFEVSADETTISMSCNAYMEGFSRVVGFGADRNEQNVSGTSVSLANSFLNYIQKKSNDFSIIDRQKVFTVDEAIGEDGYNNKTTFSLTLKINF